MGAGKGQIAANDWQINYRKKRSERRIALRAGGGAGRPTSPHLYYMHGKATKSSFSSLQTRRRLWCLLCCTTQGGGELSVSSLSGDGGFEPRNLIHTRGNNFHK
jgi:hypothetical protein